MPAGLMARDYEKVLDAAEELMTFTGYLDSEDREKRGKARGKFRSEVRIFVYKLFRETPDHGAFAFSVSSDLNRIAATRNHSEAAIAHTRGALLAEIGKRSRNSPVVRYLVRWGPPVLGLIVIAAHFYFSASRH